MGEWGEVCGELLGDAFYIPGRGHSCLSEDPLLLESVLSIIYTYTVFHIPLLFHMLGMPFHSPPFFFLMWLNAPAPQDPLEEKLIAGFGQEKHKVKNFLFGNNCKVTKSCKDEKSYKKHFYTL